MYSCLLVVDLSCFFSRWTRREEADFYRTVSTYGVDRDPATKDFSWRKFRNIARLDKKSDESLRAYYLAFRRMCEQICQWKGDPGTSDGTGVGEYFKRHTFCTLHL